MNEFCPRCNSMKSMDSFAAEREEADNQGKRVKVVTTSYYCSDCHTFVCSEDEAISERD